MAKKRKAGPVRPLPGYVPLEISDEERLRSLINGCSAPPLEKKPEEPEEKPSWMKKNRPRIEKKIRQMVGVLLYNPKRHKQT